MTFRETLDEHLRAINNRDLQALEKTLASQELTLITANGELFTDTSEFLELHRGWFELTTWTVDIVVVGVIETADLAVATIRLRYRDSPGEGDPIDELSYLTLVFERMDGRWLLVQDQNTPIKTASK
ncbi:hypothetical protein BH24ACT26_BH24ACT26_22620 [soil metagenome]